MKRLIDAQPDAQKRTFLQYENGKAHVVTEQKQNYILDHNQRTSVLHSKGDFIGNTQDHQVPIAEMSQLLYHELLQKFGQPHENPKEWFKFIESHKKLKKTSARLI